MEIKKRESWLDSAKGIAVLFVVIGHIADGYINAGLFSDYKNILNYMFNIPYSFHMALFFCLSGCSFGIAYIEQHKKNYYIKEQKKKRVQEQIINLILVYLIWSVILWGFKMVFSSQVNHEVGYTELLLIFIKPIGPFWYLYIMIALYIIMMLLDKTRVMRFYKWIAAAAFILAYLMCFLPVSQVSVGWRLVYYWFFFFIGVLICRIKFKEMRMKWLLLIISFVLSAGAVFSIIYFNIDIRNYPVVEIPAAIVISLFIILCTQCIGFIEKNRLLCFLGKSCLEIYLLHSFITSGNRVIMTKLGIDNFYISVIVNFVTAIGIPLIIAYFTQKNKKLHSVLFSQGNLFFQKKQPASNMNRTDGK